MSPNEMLRRARSSSYARMLLTLGLLAGCGGPSGNTPSRADRMSAGFPVTTAIVAATPLTMTLGVTGVTAAPPGAVAALSAPAPARIARIHVEPGSRVALAAPLVTLDAAPFAAALHEAETAGQAARLAAERAARLVTAGIAPRRDVEQARAALAQAEATLEVARRNAERATLRAPFAGVVTRLTAVLDATADPSQPLVEVVDPSRLEVRLFVAPDAAAAVPRNAPVSLTDAGGAALGTAVVTTIAPSVDSTSGSVEVRARLTSTVRDVRAGESVTAVVRLAGSQTPVLQVPESALVPDGDGYRVFVVTAGDTARARPVTIGRRTDQSVEIRRGLHAGETVVTDGAYGLEDGVRVTARAVAAAESGRLMPVLP